MRIYELAKQLGLDSKTLIDKLQALNFPVKSHMSVVDKETAEIIGHEIDDLTKKEIAENIVEVNFPITVKELAVKINKKPSEIMKELMQKGKFVTINQFVDESTAKEIAYAYKINLQEKLSKENQTKAHHPKSEEMLTETIKPQKDVVR